MSHRYGSWCLQTNIKSSEFEILQNELKSDDYDKTFSHVEKERDVEISTDNMLDFCYRLDENETPCRYRLKNIDILIPNYKENVNYFLN